eukprot:5917976-Prymnesium_polylepis.1
MTYTFQSPPPCGCALPDAALSGIAKQPPPRPNLCPAVDQPCGLHAPVPIRPARLSQQWLRTHALLRVRVMPTRSDTVCPGREKEAREARASPPAIAAT